MRNIFLILVLTFISFQSNSQQVKFIKGEYATAYPIRDLITEVPSLNEKTILPIVLENDILKAVFDKNTGRFVSLVNKVTGWQIQHRAALARSFRLAVPIPGRKDNCVYGEKQSSCTLEISNNNKTLIFTWHKLSSDCKENLDITFKGKVELTNTALQFTAEINNQSSYTVEAVYWPYLGDVNTPKTQNYLNWMNFDYAGGMNRNPVYPFFKSDKGYYGVDYPIQIYQTQYVHFGLMGNDNEGVYVGYDDITDRQLANFSFELKPGYEFVDNMNYGTVPKTDSMGGKPVHIEFSCIHFIYANPKETEVTKAIIIQPYTGDWQKGADYYKAWRKKWVNSLPIPEWTKKIHSWQQFHINSSEDYPRSSYKGLVNYARECAKYGVKAIQLTGWNLGGQDRGNPSHDIDPRLGTWEDLKTAIAECKKIGVNIILFTKFTWADESQPWFKNELIKYSIKDPYKNYFNYNGYQYQTAAQLNDINTRRLIPMCPLSAEWRNLANTEFNKTIKLGASGMLYDECQHHGGAFYCFDPNHGHHVPANVFSGDILLEKGFRKITQASSPEYLFAGESIRDLQFMNYNMSYFRISRNYIPMHRYVAPDAPMQIAVIGFNDRHTINQALLFRFILSYEPRNFKGHLDEFPLTMEYGKKMDALREKYSDFLWDGEFIGTVGATVKGKDSATVIYSVFINRKTGKRAIVIANPLYEQSVNIEAELEDKKSEFLLASPEFPELKEFSNDVIIPALSAIVLIEK